MPQREPRRRSWAFYKLLPYKKLYSQYNQCYYKEQQTEPVNAMHVFDKLCFWPVGIWFAQV